MLRDCGIPRYLHLYVVNLDGVGVGGVRGGWLGGGRGGGAGCGGD